MLTVEVEEEEEVFLVDLEGLQMVVVEAMTDLLLMMTMGTLTIILAKLKRNTRDKKYRKGRN